MGFEVGGGGAAILLFAVNEVPHAAHWGAVVGFLFPHFGQWVYCDSATLAPEDLRFPSAISPPHWLHTLEEAALRVPQKGQWKSAPAAAWANLASSSIFLASLSSWNATSAGWGAPHCLQVFCIPWFFAWQFGHSQFNST